jgi:hypothetical protein
MPDRLAAIRAELEAIRTAAHDLDRWADALEAEIAAGRTPDPIEAAIFSAYLADLRGRYGRAEAAVATLAAGLSAE